MIFRASLAIHIQSQHAQQRRKEDHYKNKKNKPKIYYINEIVSLVIGEHRCAVTHFVCKQDKRHQFETKTLTGGQLVRVLAECNYKRNCIFAIEDNFNIGSDTQNTLRCQGIQSVIIELLSARQLPYIVQRTDEEKKQSYIEKLQTRHKFNNQLERDSFTAVHEAIGNVFGWSGAYFKNRGQYE